ncbi:MAG: hypothetical protein LBG44_11690 [Gemmatimonadota bacterium]|jgi:hypothetical protein|nr:hypothetical protein [Gemmatimonadota bacterium]
MSNYYLELILGTILLPAGISGCRSASNGPLISVSAEVETQISLALRPMLGQPIEIRLYSDSIFFPGISFWQGWRVPPFGAGMEDGRPDVATSVGSDSVSLLVTRLADLPAVWKMLQKDSLPEGRTELDRVMILLNYTGQILPSQVMHSQIDAERWLFKDSTNIRMITPPSENQLPDKTIIRFFARGPIGIMRYDFIVNEDEMIINEEMIAEDLVHM